MKLTIWKVIAFCISMLSVGYVTGRFTAPPREIVVDRPYTVVDTLMVIDTVYVEQPPVYIHTPAKTDTIWLPTPEHQFQLVSSMDTILQSKGTRYGDLRVDYFHPPWDKFDISFAPAPLPTITKVKPVVTYVPSTIRHRWYQTPTFLFAAGAAAGAYLTYRVVK
jgi:hypothetical protein